MPTTTETGAYRDQARRRRPRGRPAHVMREGITVGSIGAAVAMVLFLIVDLAAGAPLRTPAMLGAALFHGARETGAVAITAPVVMGYTAVHVAGFVLFGLALSGLFALAEREKRVLTALAALTTSAGVAISGTIGFVGLVVPHLLRLAFGPDHRLLLPASMVYGSALLVAADAAARLAGGIPVGIVTALIGAPFFLWLLRRTVAIHA